MALWKEETVPVVLRVTSAQRAQLLTRLYLYVLSKVATGNQMTENKTDDAQQRRVRPSKRGITTGTLSFLELGSMLEPEQ